MQAVCREMQVADCGIWMRAVGCGVWHTSCGLRAVGRGSMSRELWIVRCDLPAMSFEPCAMGDQLWGTGYAKLSSDEDDEL